MDRQQAFELVGQFKVLQEAREYSYKIFQEGHKIYLSTGPEYDFVRFRSLVAGVTNDFKCVSDGALTIERKLRTLGQVTLADHLTSVQDAEKKKLELTAQLQLSMQAHQEHPSRNDIPLQVSDIKGQLRQVNEHIQKELKMIQCESQDLIH